MRFVKQPVEIEAVQFTGDNWAEMHAFTGHRQLAGQLEGGPAYADAFGPIGTYTRSDDPTVLAELWVEANKQWLPIEKYEWVIKDRLGFYPCKDEIFKETYAVPRVIEDVDLHSISLDTEIGPGGGRIESVGGFPQIGPECFANPEETVISWKGANYYKACDAFVSDLEDGGQSHCVKREGHPSSIHEDFDGRQLYRRS
jgi:hypothetical protein